MFEIKVSSNTLFPLLPPSRSPLSADLVSFAWFVRKQKEPVLLQKACQRLCYKREPVLCCRRRGLVKREHHHPPPFINFSQVTATQISQKHFSRSSTAKAFSSVSPLMTPPSYSLATERRLHEGSRPSPPPHVRPAQELYLVIPPANVPARRAVSVQKPNRSLPLRGA